MKTFPRNIKPFRVPPRGVILLGAALVALAFRVLHGQNPGRPLAEVGPEYRLFQRAQRVTIRGYTGDAMEPFITKDGRFLLFNNRNEKPENTNLYYARRINGLTFEFLGEIRGVNTQALEGVPSLDRQGNFYFVSDRSYATTFSTLYRGRFADGAVSGVELVPGVSRRQAGIVNFDAEISGDGNVLYFVDGDFRSPSPPRDAAIVIAIRRGDGFVRLPQSGTILAHVNSDALNYAPSVSEDGRELFFTRFDRAGTPPQPALYRAVRRNTRVPFGVPAKVNAAVGFVEAPTLSADGRSLYYHTRENGRYVIDRLTR